MNLCRSLFDGLVHGAPGTCLARFAVGEVDECEGLELVPNPAFRKEQRNVEWVLVLEPSGRYYVEDAWGWRVADASVRGRPNLVLEVEFWDEGYGLIEAQRLVEPAFNGRYVRPALAVCYTRLDSQRFRTAAFQFTEAPDDPSRSDHSDFELTGVQYLRSVRLLDGVSEGYWEKLESSIPADVEPAVTLDRPMQVVCSAGVEVHGGYGSDRADALDRCVANLREQVPLAKALGFNGIEAYVRWDLVEPAPGRFDWTFYDEVVEEVQRHKLKLFPLLIVGSAYALPKWFYESDENVGFVCLEHGKSNPVQSIWSPHHKKHVRRFLQTFGKHYEPMDCLLGVRLGPSGCYGESQYPAQGDWGFEGESMHLHIGMWAGDPYALEDFRRSFEEKYRTISALNAAWDQTFSSFDEVVPVLPEQCISRRQRIDLYTWYTDSMTAWCEWWAVEARKAMPDTPIYQSAGGWGAAEIGTDYPAQTKSMVNVDGGIRLTNELDSFPQAFYATRLAATAARCYGVPLGFEPAMGHTARGTVGRLFNCISNGGEHFFTYGPNVFNRQTSIANWLEHYELLDIRDNPSVDVALYYPQTMNFLTRDTFRYLNAWGFNPIAREIRERIEVDFLDDRLILDGFLDRYKALVFVWGNCIEQDVLERIDTWLRAGGTIIFPCHLQSSLMTVEDDGSVFERWAAGDVGKGRFFRYAGDDEPASLYAEFVRNSLLDTPTLSHITRIMLDMERPDNVYVSARESGGFLVLNFQDAPARIEHEAFGAIEIGPYAVAARTATG